MEIDPNALLVGGMALAHAVRVTVVPVTGDPVIPYMYVNPRNGSCVTYPINSARDDEVERHAQAFAKANLKGTFGCAMVARRKLPTRIGLIDVFVIDVWYPEFTSVTRLIQPFRSACGKPGFGLLGPLIIAIDRVPSPSKEQVMFARYVTAGIEMDDEVAAMWPV